MSQASKSNIKNMNKTTHSTQAATKKDNRSTPDFIRENRLPKGFTFQVQN